MGGRCGAREQGWAPACPLPGHLPTLLACSTDRGVDIGHGGIFFFTEPELDEPHRKPCRGGRSEGVPRHQAAAVREGGVAGAGRLAVPLGGHVAVAPVVAVTGGAGPVPTVQPGGQSCTVTPVARQVRGAGLAAPPGDAGHTREARCLALVPGALAVVAKGAGATPAAGHLQGGIAHPARLII